MIHYFTIPFSGDAELQRERDFMYERATSAGKKSKDMSIRWTE